MLYDKATAQPVANMLALGDTVPEALTVAAPTAHASTAYLCNRWDEEAGAWTDAPDYSRTCVWEKATGLCVRSPEAGQPLPDILTALTPSRGPSITAVWDDATAQWTEVGHYRSVSYWTADGAFHAITELGVVPPDDALYEPPATVPRPDQRRCTGREPRRGMSEMFGLDGSQWIVLAGLCGASLPVALRPSSPPLKALRQALGGTLLTLFISPALINYFWPSADRDLRAALTFGFGLVGMKVADIVLRVIDVRGEGLAHRVLDRLTGQAPKE